MNADAIKESIFRHVEKFIFGVLVVVAAFLIYQGVSKPDILAVHQPDAMEQRANQVKVSIDDDHWAAIKEPRIPALDIVARTNKTIQPVDSTVYALPHPWEAKSIESSIKRSDPAIPVPIELQVHGVIASLAFKTVEPYPLKSLEPADPAVKVEPPRARPSRRNARMEAMMMSEGGYDPAMMESSMMESSMMESSGMDSSMMVDPSMGGSGMAPAKPVRSIKADLYDQGFRPTGALTEVAPAVGHFIAGTALMPQKKIFDEFEKALAQADGYNPQRDQPYYLGFDLQRADVTTKPVDQLVEADWVTRGNSLYFQKVLLYRWSGMAKEIVAGKYRDPELTAAIPPVLLDHYAWFASHPKIPVGDEPLPGAGATLPLQDKVPTGPITPDDVKALAGKGRTSGIGGMSDMSAYDPGMSGMMMGGYGTAVKVEQPEYKLIRFYDFRDFKGEDKGAPQPGRKYVYRIRIAVEDPNFPANAVAQPRNSTLSADVFKRVAVLTEKATAGQSNAITAPRDASLYTIWSEFSAPSPVISLPPMHDSYAGPVDPGTIKAYQVAPNNVIEFHSKPPKAKVVVTKWDPAYGAAIPVFSEVMKGSVVSKEKATFEIPDPVALEVRKLPDVTVNTSNVVLDITGGRPLGLSPAENQTEPGVLLMFDPSGGLEVVDEIATQRGYRLYSFADERGE